MVTRQTRRARRVHTAHRAQLRGIRTLGGTFRRRPAQDLQRYGPGVFWMAQGEINLAHAVPWYVTLVVTEHETQHLRDWPWPAQRTGLAELRAILVSAHRFPLAFVLSVLWMVWSGDLYRTSRVLYAEQRN